MGSTGSDWIRLEDRSVTHGIIEVAGFRAQSLGVLRIRAQLEGRISRYAGRGYCRIYTKWIEVGDTLDTKVDAKGRGGGGSGGESAVVSDDGGFSRDVID